MDKATIDFIKQWIAKADEDLLVVEKLTEYKINARSSVCFHCQQAVEKLLKAFLTTHIHKAADKKIYLYTKRLLSADGHHPIGSVMARERSDGSHPDRPQ